jgi:co-chaperonin GroES (HSP10)
MRVLSNYVLINELVASEVQSMTGLILSNNEAVNARYQEGIVVMPGEAVDCIKEGDKVVYDKAQGHTVTIDGHTYRMILLRDVAIVL